MIIEITISHLIEKKKKYTKNLLPNACIIADQIRRQWTAGGKQASSALVVAMRVNGRNVFDLLEAVHFLFGELGCFDQDTRIKMGVNYF